MLYCWWHSERVCMCACADITTDIICDENHRNIWSRCLARLIDRRSIRLLLLQAGSVNIFLNKGKGTGLKNLVVLEKSY